MLWQRKKKIKLEVDDMDIERDEKARDLLGGPPPPPSTDFEEPQNCLTSLYMTWSFLVYHHFTATDNNTMFI
jgi:hypothetical protein